MLQSMGLQIVGHDLVINNNNSFLTLTETHFLPLNTALGMMLCTEVSFIKITIILWERDFPGDSGAYLQYGVVLEF